MTIPKPSTNHPILKKKEHKEGGKRNAYREGHESAARGSQHVCVSQQRTQDPQVPARPLVRALRAGSLIRVSAMRDTVDSYVHVPVKLL